MTCSLPGISGYVGREPVAMQMYFAVTIDTLPFPAVNYISFADFNRASAL